METIHISTLICMEYTTSAAPHLCCYSCASKHKKKCPVFIGCCLLRAVCMDLFMSLSCVPVLFFFLHLMHLNVLVEKNFFNIL